VSDERRAAILCAIVEGYVETSEPIGSKALASRYGLSVSPATIRNEMAILEEEGLITQPHTSSGRVPTDKGYRYFVDHLAASSLPDAQRRAINAFLADAIDLSEVVERSVRLLSQLTRQVAVVQYPSLRDSKVRRVELVRASLDRALVVVVSADARVEQGMVSLGGHPSDDEFERVAREVNEVTAGLGPSGVERALAEWVARPGQVPWAGAVAEAIVEASRGGTVERVVFAGTSHLARADAGLEQDAIAPVLEALEEQVVLLGLLHEMARETDDVAVRIGYETHHEAFVKTAIVAAGYGPSGGESSLLASLGPTRMDYPGTMAAVRAVARYLSRAVAA
jgi:heat-inducible transcriptional repressor